MLPPSSSSGLPAKGALIDGRYRVVSELGRGAMGAVLLARDQELERDVAVKLLIKGSELRFAREGELTASLRHSGIVTVHDSGRWEDRPYLVFELVPEARTLDVCWREEDLGTRGGWGRDAARAAGVAHALGIVHRDLKPENLLLDTQGRLRIADFGVASASNLERLTVTGAMVGTPQYMAPEQVRGERESYGPAIDVWALGALLYEAITGTTPFSDAGSLSELLIRIGEAKVLPPSTLERATPPALETVCMRALGRAPQSRYPHGEALALALDDWLAGRSKGSSRTALVGAVVALVVMATVIALVIGPTDAPPRPEPEPEPSVATDSEPKPEPPTPAPPPLRIGIQLDVRGEDGKTVAFPARHAFLDAKSLLFWSGGGNVALRPVVWRPLSAPSKLQPLPGSLVIAAARVLGRGVLIQRGRKVAWVQATGEQTALPIKLGKDDHVLMARPDGSGLLFVTTRGNQYRVQPPYGGTRQGRQLSLPWPRRADGSDMAAQYGAFLGDKVVAGGFDYDAENGLVVIDPPLRNIMERRELGGDFVSGLVTDSRRRRYAALLALGRVMLYGLRNRAARELRPHPPLARTLMSLAFTPDGALLGLEVVRRSKSRIATRQRIVAWDYERARETIRLELPPGVPYSSMEVAPGGEYVLLMRRDGWAEVRRLPGGS